MPGSAKPISQRALETHVDRSHLFDGHMSALRTVLLVFTLVAGSAAMFGTGINAESQTVSQPQQNIGTWTLDHPLEFLGWRTGKHNTTSGRISFR